MAQMISSLPIHYNVVEEDLHERRDKIAKNLRNSALKRGGSGLESEHHEYRYKDSLFGYERGLLLILWVHASLVITAKSI